jgi:hypothetical protein
VVLGTVGSVCWFFVAPSLSTPLLLLLRIVVLCLDMGTMQCAGAETDPAAAERPVPVRRGSSFAVAGASLLVPAFAAAAAAASMTLQAVGLAAPLDAGILPAATPDGLLDVGTRTLVALLSLGGAMLWLLCRGLQSGALESVSLRVLQRQAAESYGEHERLKEEKQGKRAAETEAANAQLGKAGAAGSAARVSGAAPAAPKAGKAKDGSGGKGKPAAAAPAVQKYCNGLDPSSELGVDFILPREIAAAVDLATSAALLVAAVGLSLSAQTFLQPGDALNLAGAGAGMLAQWSALLQAGLSCAFMGRLSLLVGGPSVLALDGGNVPVHPLDLSVGPGAADGAAAGSVGLSGQLLSLSGDLGARAGVAPAAVHATCSALLPAFIGYVLVAAVAGALVSALARRALLRSKAGALPPTFISAYPAEDTEGRAGAGAAAPKHLQAGPAVAGAGAAGAQSAAHHHVRSASAPEVPGRHAAGAGGATPAHQPHGRRARNRCCAGRGCVRAVSSPAFYPALFFVPAFFVTLLLPSGGASEGRLLGIAGITYLDLAAFAALLLSCVASSCVRSERQLERGWLASHSNSQLAGPAAAAAAAAGALLTPPAAPHGQVLPLIVTASGVSARPVLLGGIGTTEPPPAHAHAAVGVAAAAGAGAGAPADGHAAVAAAGGGGAGGGLRFLAGGGDGFR